MLIQFSVKNFYSIKELQTLSMVAANSLKEYQDNIIDSTPKVLKSAVLYGANASGKSTVIKALNEVFWLIKKTATDFTVDDKIGIEPFRLNTTSINEPSLFEIIFKINAIKYRYGFEATNEKFVAEWLFQTKRTKEKPLFIRDQQNIDVYDEFKEGKGLESKTRNNALFLSVAAQFNGAISGDILTWIKQRCAVVSGLNDRRLQAYTVQKLENTEHRKEIMNLILDGGFGINDVKVEEYEITEDTLPDGLPKELINELLKETKGKTGFNLYTYRDVLDSNGNKVDNAKFEIDESESEGTRKFINLAGPILETLKNNELLVIDELDARLHPELTQYIISKFNTEKNKGAQLIFATHDTNLLSGCNFRRDQIWFTEKDREGATDLYSLAEFKVRKDASYEKDYLKGKYGAIPFIGSDTLTYLNETNDGD